MNLETLLNIIKNFTLFYFTPNYSILTIHKAMSNLIICTVLYCTVLLISVAHPQAYNHMHVSLILTIYRAEYTLCLHWKHMFRYKLFISQFDSNWTLCRVSFAFRSPNHSILTIHKAMSNLIICTVLYYIVLLISVAHPRAHNHMHVSLILTIYRAEYTLCLHWKHMF